MEHAVLASEMSTCLTRHTGAVVIRDRRMIASGFNGNVPGAVHCVDGGCVRCAARTDDTAGAALDVCTCVHAEANAIAQCARYGSSTTGAVVVCTHRPCLDCMKLIAVAGIVEVVYQQHYPAEYETPPTVAMRRYVA